MEKSSCRRKNYLLRVKEVNEIYMKHYKRGIFVEHIYRDYIRNQFYISRSTFYSYLSVPYKKELEELMTEL